MNEQNSFNRDRPDNNKCIWMESNLISYKLCDRNYDCEDCQFYRLMRNNCNETKPIEEDLVPDIIINRIITKINEEIYNEKYLFLENQLVMKHISGNTYYLGLNPLIIILLDSITKFFLEGKNGLISKNETLLTISGDWGEKKFNSPMSLVLLDQILKSSGEILLNKWFAVVGLTQEASTLRVLSSLQFIEKKLQILKLLTEVKNYSPEIGRLMNDGGEKLKYLYQILGKEKYNKIIE